MPGRKFDAGSSYRFGFNGKENDPETYGEGNIYDYGFRIYNPRLGRFLSVDPLTSEYPWYTPYQFAGNKPVWCIDLDGLEEALPKQPAKIPLITNVSESTCIGCSVRSNDIAIRNNRANLDKLKQEYADWKANGENLGKPLPPQFEKVANLPEKSSIGQGGIPGSYEYKVFEGRLNQAYTISQYTPVTGDIHDLKDIYNNLSKGDLVAAGISAVFLIPGSDFLKPVKSLVKTDKQLLKFAKETFNGSKAFSKEANDLVDIYRKGGNPGKGTKDIGDGIMELRGANTRVYFREGKEGMEILGYSTKNNQQKVIDRIKNVYGKK